MIFFQKEEEENPIREKFEYLEQKVMQYYQILGNQTWYGQNPEKRVAGVRAGT